MVVGYLLDVAVIVSISSNVKIKICFILVEILSTLPEYLFVSACKIKGNPCLLKILKNIEIKIIQKNIPKRILRNIKRVAIDTVLLYHLLFESF